MSVFINAAQSFPSLTLGYWRWLAEATRKNLLGILEATGLQTEYPKKTTRSSGNGNVLHRNG